MGDDEQTLRQEILDLLTQQEWGFEELREYLGTSVARLEEDLRHVERTARGQDLKFFVEPARCPECGFVLSVKPERYATPSRCPSCRNERLVPPRLRVK